MISKPKNPLFSVLFPSVWMFGALSASAADGFPTIAIIDEGDAGDGFINAAEVEQVVVQGVTSNVEVDQLVTVTFGSGVGQVTVTAPVQTDGDWVTGLVDLSILPDGVLTITANVETVGGVAAGAATNTVNLDSTAPALTAVSLLRSAVTKPVFQGGTEQADSAEVTVVDSVSGLTLCVASVSANQWSCTSTPLAAGFYRLSATSVDEAGNQAEVAFTAEIDLDLDGDGIADFLEGGGDTDGDFIPDNLDLDSDNDSIADTLEHGVQMPLLSQDQDGDLIPDEIDISFQSGEDLNANGVADQYEPLDSDADGVPDYKDLDADGDLILDRQELSVDADLDGIPNFLDLDSDNDSISDRIEQSALAALTGADSDRDSIDDALDVDLTLGADENQNNLDDQLEPVDTDQDGLADYLDLDADADGVPDSMEGASDTDLDGAPNYLDLDTDNDGLLDSIEADALGVDSDADGIDDAFDVDVVAGDDLNGDSINDALFKGVDTDGDGVPDIRDLDSDNDSIFDVVEAGLPDLNFDAYIDEGDEPVSVAPNTDQATSGDNLPDFRDLDSDDDGVSDLSQLGNAALDDGAGKVFDETDTEQDGIADIVDGAYLQPGSLADLDRDGVVDAVDLDDDNDGLTDEAEGSEDPDGDGIPNFQDLDSDGDAIPDALEAFTDQETAVASDGRLASVVDDNSDGLADRVTPGYEGVDTDGDGTPDYLDLDSDNDTILDLEEADSGDTQPFDLNGDGRVDSASDMDLDGLANAVDTGHAFIVASSVVGNEATGVSLDFPDLDGDGLRNFRDPDTDGDGYGDEVEAADFNADGIVDRLQNSGEVETGVTGYGALGTGWYSLLGGLMVWRWSVLWRRRPARRIKRGLKVMRVHHRSLFLSGSMGVLASLLLLPVSETAEASNRYGLCPDKELIECGYLGLGLGVTEVDPEGVANGWRTVDDTRTGWQIMAGYKFRSNWFGEFIYADLGAAQMGNLNPNIAGGESIDYTVTALHGGYRLRPLTNMFSPFIKLGIANINTDSSTSAIPVDTVSDLQLTGTLGGVWERGDEPWFARLQFDVFDRDAHFFGLTLGLKLGERGERRHDVDQLPVAATPVIRREPPQKKPEPVVVSPVPSRTVPSKKIVEQTCRLFDGALDHVTFQTNSSQLTPNARVILDQTAATLKQVDNLKIEIQAHSDNVGRPGYNRWLSERRAKSVLDYLKAHGLEGHEMSAKGYGESMPIATNKTEAGRALNRRVQFDLLGGTLCDSQRL